MLKNLEIKDFQSLDSLKKAVKILKNDWYYFLWEFLREIDTETDELIILLSLDWKNILLTSKIWNQTELPKISDIYYSAHIFEDEIYDFYWKKISWEKNNILRLHNFPKNFFPKRKIWKSQIEEKNEYKFTKIESEWLTKVQVWPIHAWIIPPAHFRFTVDWDDTLNLDIQNWWVYRWIENYFSEEKDLEKLLKTSDEIVWDSKISSSINFAKLIEKSSNLEISEITKLNRVILIELERIYNHLWTLWAMINDIWQWYILNWFLEIRENFLNLNKEIFWNRLLSWTIWFWENKKFLSEDWSKKILETIEKNLDRFENLVKISVWSSWIYDRLFTTWIVKQDTVISHSWLWLCAKASWINQDFRQFDNYYSWFDFKIILWENWDCFDRFYVRSEEVLQSFEIIKKSIWELEKIWFENNTKNISKNKLSENKLSNWYFVSKTEWHRWENLQIIFVENWEIKYFKFKDASFVNWTLLEYAVLNNIIADFPVCNKSFDMSYSWFDL